MMKKLHSNREYWNQLKENDKVLVKSKDWYDKNAVEELTGLNVPIGPKFIPAMTEDCNKFLTVSNIIGWSSEKTYALKLNITGIHTQVFLFIS
jgi:hypothetical protein